MYLLKKHFNIPSSLPEAFTSPCYKNQTLVVWKDGEEWLFPAQKRIGGFPNYYGIRTNRDQESEWHNTYTYDTAARLVAYSYSNCIACSSFPYHYTVKYNQQGLVETLANVLPLSPRDSFHIEYDSAGSLTRLDYFYQGKLEKSIEVSRERTPL